MVVKNVVVFNLPVELAKTAQTINYTNFKIMPNVCFCNAFIKTIFPQQYIFS